jgi:hypothetical protein
LNWVFWDWVQLPGEPEGADEPQAAMATAIRGPAAAAVRARAMYLPAFRWRRSTNRCDAGATVPIPRQAATRTRTIATRLTGFPLDHVWEAER